MKPAVASSAEAETAGGFHNAQVAIPIRYMLEQLGHPQRPTLIKTDNATTYYNFIHNNINQKRSKSWDMRLYWLRDKKQQNQFLFHWEKGENNKGDYYTKHHTEKYHKSIRATYVQDVNHLCQLHDTASDLQGCVRPTGHPQVMLTSQQSLMTADAPKMRYNLR